jgi:hypothetical protein
MLTIAMIASAVLGAALIYLFLIRPLTLNWGATREEAVRSLIGDDIVRTPQLVATRAVTIPAPPAAVWRWIVQIGSARAGWYSHDRIDNAGIESARTLLPEFQRIEDDYFIPFTADQKNGMWVKSFQSPEYILWWDKKGNATWLWQLSEAGRGGTRLITRLHTRYDFTFPWIIYYLMYDLGDIIMMRKCMLGIKERAESVALIPSHASS